MAEKEKATIVVFSGDLDKVYAAFIIATTAAAMGKDVSMFFTFWGLNVLRKKKFSFGAPRFLQKMFGFMNRGGAERLPLSKFHMFGLGTFFMKFLMKRYNMQKISEMIKLAKQLKIKMIACTTSIGVMGMAKEDFIPEVDEIAGASTYLGLAFEGNVNLFI
ncbi:MAG: DsrE/DsrF/DrsH-like family protein [Candidatus Margulisbacteria bacterium]|nr:DsrE/DsrF/DrsH-like family protein [Candidatus Margulisiibacteriota bacterium]